MKTVKCKSLLDNLFPEKIEAHVSHIPSGGEGMCRIVYCKYRFIPIYRTLKKFHYSGDSEGKWKTALFETLLDADDMCTFLSMKPELLEYWYDAQRQVESLYIQELPKNKKIKIRKGFHPWYL